jgi:hypothetical protein
VRADATGFAPVTAINLGEYGMSTARKLKLVSVEDYLAEVDIDLPLAEIYEAVQFAPEPDEDTAN